MRACAVRNDAVLRLPSNIGEGSRRKKRKGSQGEVEVQLEIAQRLRFLKTADYKHTEIAVEEMGRMLNGLIVSLEPDNDYER